VYLKSLTLRGFKSFASATTLRFEPGITAVVGPNGSGKSNVVDALAWVMGEQGAKSLRGGKMEDVIFAGTAGRPPLGRAEVTLTIDNADGALPIDYSEVTITRTMFRSGGSEYAINGDACRLLDVQELLSDSGIGREMHVIVGQGQLDAVLSAGPEDRRGFIEEAAGVLKHRKRKEKALRKLEAMQANLTRVSDLVAELQRQLKPLGKQAEVARRAAAVQADLRDARLRLLADDVLTLRVSMDSELCGEAIVRERKAGVEAALADGHHRIVELDAALAEAVPAAARAQETWYRLSALRERLRGTAGMAAERVRLLSAGTEDPRPGRDPEELERESAAARAQEAELREQLRIARDRLAAACEERRAVEDELAAEEARVAAALRASADRRESLAAMAGEVNGFRARAAAAEEELGRLGAALADAAARAQLADAEFGVLESQAAVLSAGEAGLDEAHEAAATELEAAQARVVELQVLEQAAERERGVLQARKEALELALARRDGAAALLSADGLAGVRVPIAELIEVTPGHEAAVAAALGGAADAIVVDSLGAAVAGLEFSRTTDAGQVNILVGGAPTGADPGAGAQLPPHARPLLESISAPAELRRALIELVGDCVLAADLAGAAEIVAMAPGVRAVTLDGDLLTPSHAVGGSPGAPSRLEVQIAVDEAAVQLEEATTGASRLRDELKSAQQDCDAAAQAAVVTLARLNESDAELAAAAERLAQIGAAARGAHAEVRRLDDAMRSVAAAREQDIAALAQLEAGLAAAEQRPAAEATDTGERDRLASRCTAARAADVEARLAVRTAEERAEAAAHRADELSRAAAAERLARERAVARRLEAEHQRRVAEAVAVAVAATLRLLETSLTAAMRARSSAEDRRRERDAELAATRAELSELEAELDRLTDSLHRDEVARAEQRLRIENLERRAVEELGVSPEQLIAEYGPDRPVPVIGADEDAAQAVPYVRTEQEKRLRSAEKALELLGRVNPLALEEFAALQERSAFLTAQLEDLRAGRRDLLTVVREVDARVQQVFAEAYADTAREFAAVFSRLFPGGAGRLILTDPDDMLTTGVDVEARPPGKKVKRLSLLSGGERSLVAVALLIAIFRARPSPFYVLDEVEAALDDTNLGRLIGIMSELRDSSQLIVITHQKRTMEIADALYGVSMRGDGVTTVISQRLREDQPA